MSTAGYYHMTDQLLKLAGGRLVLVLEGCAPCPEISLAARGACVCAVRRRGLCLTSSPQITGAPAPDAVICRLYIQIPVLCLLAYTALRSTH